MVARAAGSRKTPDRVVQLLKEEVEKTSQAATARATGLTLRGVQNYLKSIGEPTTATLEKLAGYFGVTVEWLRGGESPLNLLENVSAYEMLHFAIKSSFPGGEQAVIDELISRGVEEETAKYFLNRTKKSFPPELIAKNWKISCEDEIIKPIVEMIYSCMVMEKDIDKEWFEEAMIETGKQIRDEIIKPMVNHIFELPTQDIISIAAIIKRFSGNEKFKNDVKQLLNNSVAHSK